MLRVVPKCTFGKYKFNSGVINKVSTLLKIQPSLANEDINFFGDVRLLNSKNQLIGVFACEEARKKAAKLGQDLIMINQRVKPALCKVCDYSDELASKFLNDIVKIKEQSNKDQHIKVGHNISMQDLKLKLNQAQQLLKKQQNLRVTIICPIEDAIQAKSILYTVRDLSQGFMTQKGDIKVKEYKEKEVFDKKQEQNEQVQLDLEFESVENIDPTADLTQIKIERLINQYYTKSLQEKTEDEQDLADLFRVQPDLEKDKRLAQQNEQQENGYMKVNTVVKHTESFFLKDAPFSKYVKLLKLIEWSQSKK